MRLPSVWGARWLAFLAREEDLWKRHGGEQIAFPQLGTQSIWETRRLALHVRQRFWVAVRCRTMSICAASHEINARAKCYACWDKSLRRFGGQLATLLQCGTRSVRAGKWVVFIARERLSCMEDALSGCIGWMCCKPIEWTNRMDVDSCVWKEA
jgi:hypothetical protein